MIMDFAMEYGPKLIGAIITLVIGLWVIKTIMNGIEKGFKKREIDPSLIPFLKGLIGALLKIMLIVSVMSMVGIAMTSFVAILGAMGLAVGMALSGTLQNFAGGVIILILKPFKVGDFIDAQGYSGTVNSIQIFNTILKNKEKEVAISTSPLISKTVLTSSAYKITAIGKIPILNNCRIFG